MQVRKKVYSIILGKLQTGIIVATYNQLSEHLSSDTRYKNGFKVKWQDGNVIEYPIIEMGTTIFSSEDEARARKLEENASQEIQLSYAKDYYGIELKVGDFVKPVIGRVTGKTGYIKNIYIKKSGDLDMTYLKLVDSSREIIAVDQDSRNYTKAAIAWERKLNMEKRNYEILNGKEVFVIYEANVHRGKIVGTKGKNFTVKIFDGEKNIKRFYNTKDIGEKLFFNFELALKKNLAAI